jgi:hypothetical protein
MRFTTTLSLLLALATPLVAGEPLPAPVGGVAGVDTLSDTDSSPTSPAKDSDIKAPEMMELTAANFWDTISKGYW